MPYSDVIASIVTALKKAELIPDVIPSDFTPTVLLSIIWPSGKDPVLSAEIQRSDTLEEPDITFTPMVPPDEQSKEGEVSYTLVMTDPDAPSRADRKWGQWRHWVITGLKSPAGETAATNIRALKTHASSTDYYPPSPPPGSGAHRYAFLLFEEPTSGFLIPAGAPERKSAAKDRPMWNAMEFANEHGLKLVGAYYFVVRGQEG